MTAEDIQAFEEKLYSYVGREVSTTVPAKDPVNPTMIRHWAEVMGETNPAYLDEEWASKSARGHRIAPPAMMYVWGQEGFSAATSRAIDTQVEMVNFFDEHGYTGVLGTNVRQEYFKEVELGDTISVSMTIDNISERKNTARGTGYFFETLAVFTNQAGEKIGTQRFKVLKFIPKEQPAAAAADTALEVPTRIASPRGHDNKWWWDACDEGKLMIQRCTNCGALRHPPRPMCGECQSMEWEAIESTMEGEVLSYTELHHPKIPGYQYPLICAVIALKEGTNFVSNIVGCDPADVHIGMQVKGKVEQVDEKTMLPQFYPV